ncbi:MAG: 30S ribosome-binding factor RbfA [Elusimicrobiota bacterium]
MKKSRRTERVSSLLQEEIGKIVTREIKVPGLGLITITEVEVSIDLKLARVYYTVLGGSREKENQRHIIEGKAKFIRKRVGASIKLKYTPFIELIYDKTPEKAFRIEKIIKKIKNG